MSRARSRESLFAVAALATRARSRRLPDFSWHLVWSPSGSTLRDAYRLVSRELECIWKLRHALEKREQVGIELLSKENADTIKAALAQEGEALKDTQEKYLAAVDARKSWPHCDDAVKTGDLLRSFAVLQKRLGRIAGVLMKEMLVRLWEEELTPVASTVPRDIAARKSPLQRIAEEYVSLVYANFLIGVLLRMRTLVLEAIGIGRFFIAFGQACIRLSRIRRCLLSLCC